jgi:hypothetical protein
MQTQVSRPGKVSSILVMENPYPRHPATAGPCAIFPGKFVGSPPETEILQLRLYLTSGHQARAL